MNKHVTHFHKCSISAATEMIDLLNFSYTNNKFLMNYLNILIDNQTDKFD